MLESKGGCVVFTNIMEDLSAKEAHLREQIHIYRTNIDQLVRIRALEEELKSLKDQVEATWSKQVEEEKARLAHEVFMKNIQSQQDHVKSLFPAMWPIWIPYGKGHITLPPNVSGHSVRIMYFFKKQEGGEYVCTAQADPFHLSKYFSGVWNGQDFTFTVPCCQNPLPREV